MESLRPGDPTDIGGYRLLARLGEGGMGEVFLARTASGRPLALKTVHRELSLEPGFAERFAREIRTNDRVRSPWTVSVVDFSPPGATPQWLATEYVAAPSLADWVRQDGPLPEQALRRLALELSAALVAVDAVGVVHRDIKPANVLLGPERPFLIDFGIARAVRDARRTQTGTVIGTPGYLAPEQATGAVAGAPADVFSLAAVLVYAATGRGPFVGPEEELGLPALLYRIVHDEPVLDGVPESVAPLVAQCLAKDPEQRPTAEEVRARLAAAEPEWPDAVPAALLAETTRREADLRTRLAAGDPQPPPADAPGAVPPPATTPPAPGPYAPPHLPTAPGTPPPATPRPGTDAIGTRPVTGRPGRTGAPHRTKAITAVVGVTVLAAAVALLVRYAGSADDHGDKASPPASHTPTTTPATGPAPATAKALPASWVGAWTGTGPGTPDADGISRARTKDFKVTVTFRAGVVGEVVGSQVSDLREVTTGRNLGCTEALELRQINGGTAVLAAVTSHPTDRSSTLTCPSGNQYVVTMSAADRLTLEAEGAQSAGAPDTLTRRR
ncbi:serine/threonine-protein kinase [Streptomyces sp. NRRL S-87]|uniref:serine/threonine-protein kinase n=1 Tax=Streptomyces sp. NRRL S-87 TaxID=1463920 RepID=UPI00068D11ED|nr:serine/threonine-protein kinase [Streptomyces sp. NRRL S-87]